MSENIEAFRHTMLAGMVVGAYSVSAILAAKGLSGGTSRNALAASEMESVTTSYR